MVVRSYGFGLLMFEFVKNKQSTRTLGCFPVRTCVYYIYINMCVDGMREKPQAYSQVKFQQSVCVCVFLCTCVLCVLKIKSNRIPPSVSHNLNHHPPTNTIVFSEITRRRSSYDGASNRLVTANVARLRALHTRCVCMY